MRRLSLRQYQKTNNSQGELIPRLPESEDPFRLGRIISIGIWRRSVHIENQVGANSVRPHFDRRRYMWCDKFTKRSEFEWKPKI